MSSTLTPIEIAGAYVGHIKAAESDALHASLRAARARAAGNTEQAEAEERSAKEATDGAAAIRAQIPSDLTVIVDAIAAQQAVESKQQFEAAERMSAADTDESK